MKKSLYMVLGILIAGLAFQYAAAQDQKTERALTVKLHYTGTGTVDEKHNIHVFIFDSPDFVHGGSIPSGMQTATSKNGTVTFSDTGKSPVFVSAVYDPAGGYDGQSGPPPSGASLGLYHKTPGEPAPVNIDAGASATIDITFDDRVKMP
ncbi:MAG: hypothetical protein ACRD2S_06520 [Terriglobales bacterium]